MDEIKVSIPNDIINKVLITQINKVVKDYINEMTEVNWDTKTAAERTGLKEDRVKAIFRNQKCAF